METPNPILAQPVEQELGCYPKGYPEELHSLISCDKNGIPHSIILRNENPSKVAS